MKTQTPEEIWSEMPTQEIEGHEIMTVEDAYRIAEAYHAQFEHYDTDMKTKITFEKLTDGTCVITVKGKNMHGDTYIRQELIKSSAVFDALKERIEGK